MQDLCNLKGRVALVTGASSGLGVQFAHTLARYGAHLALIARRRDKLEHIRDKLAPFGGNYRCYTTDVTDPKQVEECVGRTTNDFGSIDILINNAGVASVEPTEDHTLESWQKVVNTNLTGVFLFTKYVGRIMIGKRYGRIVNISSMYGAVGNRFMPASSYHASKGAVNTFTRAVAAEWAKHNITVNAIAPGFFWSEMTAGIMDRHDFKEFVRWQCPMERTGHEGELDGALLLFVSDTSSYITGQVLYVDGGWTSV